MSGCRVGRRAASSAVPRRVGQRSSSSQSWTASGGPQGTLRGTFSSRSQVRLVAAHRQIRSDLQSNQRLLTGEPACIPSCGRKLYSKGKFSAEICALPPPPCFSLEWVHPEPDLSSRWRSDLLRLGTYTPAFPSLHGGPRGQPRDTGM